ncbi:hypothetical protein EON63_22585 [archaeon]|nr:MAG: hypothetical protein EON63_22585 [archaeon]
MGAGGGGVRDMDKAKAVDEDEDAMFTFDRTSSYGAGSMYLGDEGVKSGQGGTLQDLVRRVDEEVEQRGGSNKFVDLKQLRKR